MFDLAWHDAGAIAAIRLNRPPANAIGLTEIRELDALLDELPRRPSCRGAVFHAQGRFFSAGADLALMGRLADAPDGPERLGAMARQVQATFDRLEALPFPSVCAVAGICVGGGLELALACDLRITEPGATFGLPEAKIGLLPGAGGTQRLAALAGLPVAKRLILTGELISGEDAHRCGIVQDIVPPGEAFESALTLARAMAAAPRRTVEAIKRCLALAPSRAGYEAEIEETHLLHAEPQTKALIAAFLARSPNKERAAE